MLLRLSETGTSIRHAWINDYIHMKLWDEIIHPCHNFSRAENCYGYGVIEQLHPTENMGYDLAMF